MRLSKSPSRCRECRSTFESFDLLLFILRSRSIPLKIDCFSKIRSNKLVFQRALLERRSSIQRSRHVRVASGTVDHPRLLFRINLLERARDKASKAYVSPRTDCSAMIRVPRASFLSFSKRFQVILLPPVPLHHRPPPASFSLLPLLLSAGVRRRSSSFVTDGWSLLAKVFCAVASHNDTGQKLSMLPCISFHACISSSSSSTGLVFFLLFQSLFSIFIALV